VKRNVGKLICVFISKDQQSYDLPITFLLSEIGIIFGVYSKKKMIFSIYKK